jgi:hypothetical protein
MLSVGSSLPRQCLPRIVRIYSRAGWRLNIASWHSYGQNSFESSSSYSDFCPGHLGTGQYRQISFNLSLHSSANTEWLSRLSKSEHPARHLAGCPCIDCPPSVRSYLLRYTTSSSTYEPQIIFVSQSPSYDRWVKSSRCAISRTC